MKRLFLGSLFVLSLTFLCGQRFNFTNYSVSEGLAQSQVYSICEDRRGYLWFGTWGGGVSLFNGFEFETLSENEGLVNNFVNCIYEDSRGDVWIGTKDGLTQFKGDTLINFTKRTGLGATSVLDISENARGELLFATSKGLLSYAEGGFHSICSEAALRSPLVNDFALDAKGGIWMATAKGLNYRVGEETYDWVNRHALGTTHLTSLLQENDSSLWIASYGAGLFHKQGEEIVSFSGTSGVSADVVVCLYLDRSRRLWVGTEGQGVFKYEDGKFYQFTMEDGLPHNTVRSIFEDSWGNLWFGTSGGGVSRFDGEMFVHYSSEQGLSGGGVYSIWEDFEGSMWFGTFGGGVSRMDSIGVYQFNQYEGFTRQKVKAILQTRDSTLWFGTEGDGLYSYREGRFRRYEEPGGWIKTIREDRDSSLWTGASGDGLCHMTGDTMIHYYQRHGLINNRVNDLAFDQDSALWIATDGGVCVLRGDSIQTWGPSQGVPRQPVKSVERDAHGVLWFGTKGGGIFSIQQGKVVNYTTSDGLTSNIAYLLFVDSTGFLWVGSEKGLDRVTLNDLSGIQNIRHYGKGEGFAGIETCQNAAFQDRQGYLWFGTIQGVTRYNPTKDNPRKIPPKLHFTGLRLFYEAVKPSKMIPEVDSWSGMPVSLQLPHRQNHLTFDFVGISLKNASKVRYQWRLLGFEEEWSPVVSERSATYSNLSPGVYEFQAKAVNENGIWVEEPLTYAFVIHPPYWQEWWFRILVVGLFLLLAYLTYRWIVYRVNQRNAAKQQQLEMERKSLELEQQALRLQMNPHFLFNCLNSIKGYISENRTKEAKIQLAKFAKLMRSILDNSREAFIPVENEVGTLKAYLELEQLSHEDKFDFAIELDPVLEKEEALIPPMIVQPFIENAIIHGIAPSESRGHIVVRFLKDGNVVKCEIEDNGIGRKKAADLQKQSVQKHKSAGIQVTQERLNALNHELGEQKLDIVIDDLEEQGQAAGTRVTLYLPIRN